MPNFEKLYGNILETEKKKLKQIQGLIKDIQENEGEIIGTPCTKAILH